MSFASGICYTESGDKKMYEPDLFKAELEINSHERCYRHDSANSKTLVFENDYSQDGFHAYLPYSDTAYSNMSINHSIQDNGEDHYKYSGTYNGPNNWSPPPGLDGPFYGTDRLEYPYYEYTYSLAYYIYTQYNNVRTRIYFHVLLGEKQKYYGKRRP